MTTRWLTSEEVADILRVDIRTVQRHCKRGWMRCKKVGHQWRIHPSEIEMDTSENAGNEERRRDRQPRRREGGEGGARRERDLFDAEEDTP